MRGFLRQCLWNLRLNFRSRDGVFWVIFYPMLLLIFMNLAFAKLQGVGMPEIRLALLPGLPEKAILSRIPELELREMKEDEGRAAVEAGSVDALLLPEGRLFVTKLGSSQEILQTILTEIRQTEKLALLALPAQSGRGEILSIQDSSIHPLKITYLNVFATFCLYGYFFAVYNFSCLRANQGPVSLRQAMATCSRGKLFMSAALCSALMAVLAQLGLILLSEAVLKLGVIQDYPHTLAILGSGILLGIALGAVMGILKLPEWFRLLFMIAGSLILGFLSGLMLPAIRGFFSLHAPWLLKINPVALSCEGLFQVNLLGESSAAWEVVSCLVPAAFLLFAAAYLILRRQRFQSL